MKGYTIEAAHNFVEGMKFSNTLSFSELGDSTIIVSFIGDVIAGLGYKILSHTLYSIVAPLGAPHVVFHWRCTV